MKTLHLQQARLPITLNDRILKLRSLTDEMLRWQTEKLLDLEISRDEWTVYVRPELVVEIAFSDLQESPRYPGGLALRFARVKSYREDKSSLEADNIQKVWQIFEATRR